MRLLLSWAIACICLSLGGHVQAADRDTVVVCPAEYRRELAPWIELRHRQGHDAIVVSSQGTDSDVRERIRAANRQRPVKFVLLVGAAPAYRAEAPAAYPTTPVHLETAKVVTRWGSEPQIASDSWFVDLAGDGAPSAAIGRLTVRSADELTHVIKKIAAYEAQREPAQQGPAPHEPAEWRARINFVAGVGGFSPLIDSLIENTARRMIDRGVPGGYETTFTYANWRSAYCPDPRQFRDALCDRLNEGCLFWVYMGHASPFALDRVRTPDGRFASLDTQDARQLHCAQGSPIAIFLSCYAGAFDAQNRCLGDEMLVADGGPVAVIGGSRVTMPYAMAVLATELMDECFERRRPTLGEALLSAKRHSVESDPARLSPRRQMLDALAAAFSPQGSDLAAERAEHVHLFNLLGDPLLRLPLPESATVEVSQRSVKPGDRLTVSGATPLEGRCTVELMSDQAPAVPERPQFDASSAALAAYQPIYRAANQHCRATAETPASAGHYAADIKVPADVSGPCHVRVVVVGPTGCAVGAASLQVSAAP